MRTVCRDNLNGIAFGLRYFSELGKTRPHARKICEALRGDDETALVFELGPEQFGSSNAFYDAAGVAFTLMKLLFLSYPYQACVMPAADAGSDVKVPAWRSELTSIEGAKVETVPVRAKIPALAAPSISIATPAATAAHREALLRLGSLLDKLREGRDLHLTTVRNEHAYFCCALDILRLPPPSLAVSVITPRPIFAVGDSHVLSPAWQTVTLPGLEGQDEHRVIVPCLVTGAKIYHLRPKSKFYTKAAFWERISAVPPGEPVMIMLGEIDCREGVLQAVQKGRHASVEAALAAVVGIYVDVLREVRKKLPRSPMFVHPLAHVLPETRFLTMAFNRLLTQEPMQGALVKAQVRLLQFPSVFSGEGANMEVQETLDVAALQKLDLLPELRLDGTHMSPTYVASHLAPALAGTWKEAVPRPP